MPDQHGTNRSPGMAFAGFLLPFALLIAVAVAYQGQLLRDVGWRGGEYAYLFIGVAIGTVLAGCALGPLRPRSPWRAFGTGMVVAGTLGVVLAVAVVALFVIAMSRLGGGS